MLSASPRITPDSIRHGFSLIELSMVVAILAVVAVLGLETSANFINRSSGAISKDRLAAADASIDRFFRLYGRLPCPADRSLAPLGNLNYGLEDCTLGAFAGTTIGGGVVSGAVPFRTLNLPLNASLDGYGNKLNYSVTKNLSVAGGDSTPATINRMGSTGGSAAQNGIGGIEIRTGVLQQPCNTASCQVIADPAATTPDGAAYILFSSGYDRRGAVNAQGGATIACIPSPAASYNSRVDTQNCVRGTAGIASSMTVTTIPFNVFYDNRYNTGTSFVNAFDDYVLWRKRSQL